MNSFPKITVIIPCYNVESYIQKCIESVLNQSYGNIEIILIDDGSTDNTNEVILKSIENISNILYIRNDNFGVSNARNTGIKNATGDYIMFIDSDDYISKNMIKNMYKLLIKYNSDIVKCNIKKEYAEGQASRNEKPVYSSVKYFSKEDFSKTIYKKILSTETMNSSCCSLFKTDIIKNNELFFREDIYNGEDAIFFMNYIDNCKSMVYTPTPYYHYVIKGTGLTGSALSMEKLWDSKLKFIQELKYKEKSWSLEKHQYVNKKIIYITMSSIFKLYKKSRNETSKFKEVFLNKMIEDVNLVYLLKKVKYKKMNFTNDRIDFLNSIKENRIDDAIKIIESI